MTSYSRCAPILLLHGQPGSARDWDRVAVAIGDRAEAIATAQLILLEHGHLIPQQHQDELAEVIAAVGS